MMTTDELIVKLRHYPRHIVYMESSEEIEYLGSIEPDCFSAEEGPALLLVPEKEMSDE